LAHKKCYDDTEKHGYFLFLGLGFGAFLGFLVPPSRAFGKELVVIGIKRGPKPPLLRLD
jgi:hypothetical protein